MGNSKREFFKLEQDVDRELSTVPDDITRHLSSLVTTDKAGITALAQNIVNSVELGISDHIREFGLAKKLAELAELVMKNLRPKMLDSLNISKGEPYVKDNVRYESAETGVKYDYEATGDKIYNEIMERFNKVSKEKTDREAFLKTVTKDTGQFDPETSESWVIKPPIRSGQMGFKSELI